MIKNLKYFLKHSAIYSISNAAVKASGVILLPLYTEYLATSEFGVLAILEATMIIAVDLLNFGLGQSLVMMNNSWEFRPKQKSMFFSITFTSVIIIILFVIFGELTIPFISGIFDQPDLFYNYLRIILYVIAFRILYNLFLNKLRADDKSGLYTLISITKLAFTILLIIYFIAFAKLSVLGILYSYLIIEAIAFLTFTPLMIKKMELKFERKIISAAARFGIPLIFGSIAMMLLNLSDRYIIKYLTDYSTVGIYDIGYRFAGVLNMFLIMPFGLALMPIAYKMYGQEGDKRYYSKIMTYLTYILVWAGLVLSVFSMEVIKVFSLNPEYWSAYKVVPIVVFSYIFFGMRFMSSLGMFLTKNTKYVAYSTMLASALNIALNFWLIPIYGMIAAAYNTLISFILLYFVTLYYSNKFFVIPFEHAKLIKVIMLGVVFYIAASFTNSVDVIVRLPVKIILAGVFPFILHWLHFYDEVELENIFRLLNKWKNPANWKENIKTQFSNSVKK